MSDFILKLAQREYIEKTIKKFNIDNTFYNNMKNIVEENCGIDCGKKDTPEYCDIFKQKINSIIDSHLKK